MNRHSWTVKENTWLAEHLNDYESYAELAKQFNLIFNQSFTHQHIHDHVLKVLKLHRNRNAGRFSKGEVHAKTYPIGSEVVYQGYIFIKVKDDRCESSNSMDMFYQNWMPKQRYVYEKAHGQIPDGSIVIFLDNDKMNCDADNLYCVDRKIHAVMCKNRWYTHDREHTLTAIKWCELFYTLKTQTLSDRS